MSNSSIWPIDRSLSGATSPAQSKPGSDGNEGLLHVPQSFWVKPHHHLALNNLQSLIYHKTQTTNQPTKIDMTSWLIWSCYSDHTSYPLRAKVECCMSLAFFDCQVKGCSAIRNPSSNNTSRHPRPTGDQVDGGGKASLLQSFAVGVFYSPSRQGIWKSFKCWWL